MTAVRNTGVLEQYTADLRRLGNPVHAWGDIINAHLMIPQLRGFWPYSSVDQNGNVYDLSRQGRTLTNNGSISFAVNNSLLPYASFDGSNDYFSRADEAGFTIIDDISIGGWFYLNNTSSYYGLMSKWLETGNQRSYRMYFASSPYFQIFTEFSYDGATSSTVFDVPGSPDTISSSSWFHVIVTRTRVSPTTYRMNGYINGDEKGVSVLSGSSAVFDGTADFEIGSYNGGSNKLNGRSALCFLSAAQLSAEIVSGLYDISKPLLGVE